MAYISLEDFTQVTQISKDDVLQSITPIIDSQLSKIPIKDGIVLFLQKIENQLIATDMNANILEPIFLERTIQTLTFLYEQLLTQTSQQEIQITQENNLLKETILSLQEEAFKQEEKFKKLTQEIQQKNEEIEFLKRKHQLMWGKIKNLGMIKE